MPAHVDTDRYCENSGRYGVPATGVGRDERDIHAAGASAGAVAIFDDGVLTGRDKPALSHQSDAGGGGFQGGVFLSSQGYRYGIRLQHLLEQ